MRRRAKTVPCRIKTHVDLKIMQQSDTYGVQWARRHCTARRKQSVFHLQDFCLLVVRTVHPTRTCLMKKQNIWRAAALGQRSADAPHCSRLCVVYIFEEDGFLASMRCTLGGAGVLSLARDAHFR